MHRPVATADWFLQHFVKLANNPEYSVEVSITLNVGGVLVYGTLIGGKTYFSAIGDLLSKANTNMPDVSNQWKSISDFGSIYQPNPEDEQPAATPEYIHLKNAKTIVGDSHLSAGPGGWWRGRVAEVSGFNFGSF